MGYSPRYRKAAEKYLDSQTLSVREQIMDAVDALPDGDVRKLQGRDGYRLTIGGFRVLFNYTREKTVEGEPIIDIVLIGPRGDVYKK